VTNHDVSRYSILVKEDTVMNCIDHCMSCMSVIWKVAGSLKRNIMTSTLLSRQHTLCTVTPPQYIVQRQSIWHSCCHIYTQSIIYKVVTKLSGIMAITHLYIDKTAGNVTFPIKKTCHLILDYNSCFLAIFTLFRTDSSSNEYSTDEFTTLT